MSRSLNVYGIGNAIMDLQLKISEEGFTGLGLTKGSMNLLGQEEQFELLNKLKNLGEPHQASGGSAANSMIALAQLGGTAAYGCLVGDDEFGRFYSKEMSEIGITLYTHPETRGSTGSSVILITPDAERTMNTHLGISAEFGPEHVSSRLVGEADWLFVEGYLFSSVSGQEAVKRAIKYAMKRGTKIAVVFSDAFIVESFGEPLREAVKYADLIIANHTEAKAFTGEDEPFDSFKTKAPNCAMTQGSEGAFISLSGESFHVAADSVAAVDETGAGDMFAGALLYGLTNGLSGEDSGKLACKLAGQVVSQLGPRLLRPAEEIRKEVGCQVRN